MADSGDPEGEEGTRRGPGGGDLADLACLSRRDLSGPGWDCCCLACWRHLARRFLNQTCIQRSFSAFFMGIPAFLQIRQIKRYKKIFKRVSISKKIKMLNQLGAVKVQYEQLSKI